MAPDVVPTSAAVLTLASVPPLPAPPAEHDAGALEASLTLESLSMPVLVSGVLGPGQVAQLPGSPGTRADIPAGAESTAEQDKEEQRKKAQVACCSELVVVSHSRWAAVFSTECRPTLPAHVETHACARAVAAGSQPPIP